MKIAVLTTRMEKPSARYRALQHIPFLKSHGHIPEALMIPRYAWSRALLFKKLQEYDIVFLQKKLLNTIELKLLKSCSRHLVYDFDDAVMFRDSMSKKYYLSKSRQIKFSKTVETADLVIAGNKYLQDFAININPNTYIIPTPIDTNRYTVRPEHHSSEHIIIGWIGSTSTLYYLERMKHV